MGAILKNCVTECYGLFIPWDYREGLVQHFATRKYIQAQYPTYRLMVHLIIYRHFDKDVRGLFYSRFIVEQWN